MRWQWAKTVFLSYPFLGLVGAVLGLWAFFTVGRGIPKVGVITIPYTILYAETAVDIASKVLYARERPDIKAVVVRLDSPGGTVSASEEVFLQFAELRQRKPLVVAVDDLAASGCYMAVLGANYVFVKPTSFVGNVGAIFLLPRDIGRPIEDLVTTGPFKAEGASYRMYVNMLEMIKEAFWTAVQSQRGERLRLSREEVLTGRVYLGMEAVRYGLADEVGTVSDAIRKAAQLAGLRRYTVVDVNAEMARLHPQGGAGYTLDAPGTPKYQTVHALLSHARFPYIYYLYVEPR
ncbi:Protease 4 [bacterium HR23]|nr:Protease 4 [bacterium HR23]